MNLLDANVWLALVIDTHQHHGAATQWFADVDREDSVRFCRSTQQALVRLLTTASVTTPYGVQPRTNDEAWAVFDALEADDRISLQRAEPNGLDSAWRRYASRPSASPKVWMDSYLAAFAVAADLTLVTLDGAFRQFSGLDVLVLG